MNVNKLTRYEGISILDPELGILAVRLHEPSSIKGRFFVHLTFTSSSADGNEFEFWLYYFFRVANRFELGDLMTIIAHTKSALEG